MRRRDSATRRSWHFIRPRPHFIETPFRHLVRAGFVRVTNSVERTPPMDCRYSRCVAACLAIAAAFAWHAPALPAQGTPAPPLELTRLKGAITIDGVPDEPAWQDIPTLPLTLYTPVFRGTPTQRTAIRVAYDDEYFYAAGWLYDTEPSSIRVNSLYRDRWNGDDALAIYLDPFYDNRRRRTASTSTSGCATLSPRARISGSCTTRGWTPIGFATSSTAFDRRRLWLGRSRSSTPTRSGSRHRYDYAV